MEGWIDGSQICQRDGWMDLRMVKRLAGWMDGLMIACRTGEGMEQRRS